MKKIEKVAVIKWYVKNWCGSGEIQTKAKNTNDLKELEQLVMNDRSYPHCSACDTCWHNDSCRMCGTCEAQSNYTFPYGYWKRVCEKRGIQLFM